MMTDCVYFGSLKIDFVLQHAKRKSLGISVLPDLSVIVKAPLNANLEKIKERVVGKAGWILKQQNFFLSFYPKTTPRKFISGETHLFRGRQYRLKIIKGNIEKVGLKGHFIEIITGNAKKVKKLLADWYKKQAKKIFNQYAKPLIEQFKKYKVRPSSIQIREMSNRWGSCTPKGKIILNPGLVKAPKSCVEYVIVHELCHLVHPNHTKKFFELQKKEMPNWQKRKKRLEVILS